MSEFDSIPQIQNTEDPGKSSNKNCNELKIAVGETRSIQQVLNYMSVSLESLVI